MDSAVEFDSTSPGSIPGGGAMARSTYVYVVMDQDKPVSGFTVKHEMKTWLERYPGEYTIWRINDGLGYANESRPPVDMTDELK